MKLNWGTSIAIFYITFMVVMVSMVIKSTTYDNSLVVDDYYAKDLAYQGHFEKLENAQNLSEPVVIAYHKEQARVKIQFPKAFKQVTGTILLFRPSDQSKDVVVPIILDENRMVQINTTPLFEGLWKVKIDWKANGKEFYMEDTVTITPSNQPVLSAR